MSFAKDMFKDVIEVREVDEQLSCLFNKVMIQCWNMDCCWMVGMDHGSSVLKGKRKEKDL